ncbi:RimK/LysX family protein [Guyparkeria halophila]|uniref:RimK/LysX family protein n=1 Tax=Guyparkeria halophila TaxID=47960 RepID=A0ABZ0YY62_9GAMM|nr:RimK/LysX family protein [Guyparkeria halophila]WQH16971.1 RimK/LysX family protein [Guyparkeria halophila]
MKGYRIARPGALTAALLACLLVTPAQADEAKHKQIYGYIEDVRVMELERSMRAKLDTGATTSSIDAREIEKFEKDDEDWVRFTVVNRDTDERRVLEEPVSRIVHIKRHGKDSQERYVVDLDFCIGDRLITEEVSLTNREKWNYPLLVGRNHLAGHVLVDSAIKDTREPSCD